MHPTIVSRHKMPDVCRGFASALCAWCALACSLGCSESKSSDAGGSGAAAGSGAGGAVGFEGSCEHPITDDDGNRLVMARDELDYSFQSSLEIQTVRVRSMSDLTFDWSEITEDMLGHPFDPLQSVDMLEVMIWRYSSEDLMRDIASDSLDTTNLVALGQLPTHNTLDSANLLEVRSPSGGVVDEAEMLGYLDTTVYAPEEHTYLAIVAEGTTFGKGSRMISFFEPAPDETNTEVRLTNDSTTLHYTADLTSLTRVAVPAGLANVVFDWSDDEMLVHNAMGQPWVPTRITDVQVAHYVTQTPTDLENEFLNLELLADEEFGIHLTAGQSVNLSRLTDENGEPFAGIDETGTWILALKCGSCANPAPLFLTILETCP